MQGRVRLRPHPFRVCVTGRGSVGDCYTYALARMRGGPVLCVGDDFARTDVSTVL
jgi:uncharacterized protein with PIN domain